MATSGRPAHAIVDDHPRLAYVELLEDEKASTVTAFVARALAWFTAHGIHPKRLMTTARSNAFHHTMAEERAYGLAYRSHHHRNHALAHRLKHHNTNRPHSGTENRPPISRVHNLRGQDS